MNNIYCKNCNNIVGKWNNIFQDYDAYNFCYLTELIKNNFMYFLDCKKCNKYVGLFCYNVCKNCFGEKEIIGEENLFNWFLKYKKINSNFICKICNNKYKFRYQFWFFKELTFYNK